ncbi:MAG: GIY-YIG nuclease family protein [Patescibacteria group bacterium]|nr:GIY-YIG nuclease family protein [Patescibacteria group bacterium]
MYYVYLLKLNNDTIYTGRSDNLKRRIIEHQQGKVRSTKNKLPVLLIYYEAYLNKKDATARELYLKTGDGRQEARKQLRNVFKVELKHNKWRDAGAV